MSNNSKNIEYKNFSSKYLDDIIKIANKRFGKNYYNRENFIENLNKSKGMCTVAIDKLKNEVLGYCIFFEESLKKAEKHFKIPIEELVSVTGSGESICHTKSIALKENCEKAGIGTELFRITLDKAQKLGYKVAWCPAWIRENYIPVGNVLKRNNFTYYKTVGNLWEDDKDYKCVVCSGPCKCSAAVYYKILN